MKHKIDSITEIRIRESDEQARRDLDRRMKIEVKVKADSIYNANLNGGTKTKTDSLQKAGAKPPVKVMPQSRIISPVTGNHVSNI